MKEPDSNDQERLNALYSLSQLAYLREDYRQATVYLLRWMDLEEFPSSDSFSLLSQAYFQLVEY